MALSTTHKLYISVGVLAVLGGALYFQNQKLKEEALSYSPEKAAAELPKLQLSDKETEKVDKIVIKKPGGGDAGPAVEVTLEKKGETWELTKPIAYKANENNVKSLLSSLQRLEVKEQVDTGAQSYAAFGLTDDKALHAVFYQGGKVVLDAYFGESGSRGQMTRVPGREGVFSIQGYSSYSFGRDVKGWRDLSIFKVEDAKVKSVEIVNETGTFTFVRGEKKAAEAKPKKDAKGDAGAADAGQEEAKQDEKATTWIATFKGPKDAAAKPIDKFDEAKVGDLLRAFKALNADGFGDGKALAEVGLDAPAITVTITLEDGARRVLLVGKTAEGSSRWAKASDNAQIFSIGSWTAGWATADVAKFQKSDDKKPSSPPGGMPGGMPPGMMMGGDEDEE